MASSPRSPRLAVEALEDRTVPTFLPRPGGPLAQQIVVNNATVPTAGLSVAAGDVIRNEVNPFLAENEYVLGSGPGGPGTVRVFALGGELLRTFTPFAGYTGAINVAVGDVLGDDQMEIIAAVGVGGPPHVKVLDSSGRELLSFLAFDNGFLGGLNVAVGNVLGGIGAGGFPGGETSTLFKQEIIIGAASGGSPHVVVANGQGAIVRSFLAFDLGFRGGVTVAAASIDTVRTPAFLNGTTTSDTNAYDEIIVGSAIGAAHVKAFEVFTGAITERLSFFAFDPGTSNGVTVAAGSTDGTRGAEIYAGQVGGAQPIVRVFNEAGVRRLEFAPFPPLYTGVMNMVVAPLGSGFGTGFGSYLAVDDDFFPGGFDNFDFLGQDLALVAGDGPLNQQPRFYRGNFLGIPAGGAGPDENGLFG